MSEILQSVPAVPSRSSAAVRVAAGVGLVAVITSAGLADDISSWLPKIGGFPAGAIIRDTIAILFVFLAGITLIQDRPEGGRLRSRPSLTGGAAEWAMVPFALLAVWVILLVVPSPAKVPALLAARNLLLYVAVGLAAYVLLVP